VSIAIELGDEGRRNKTQHKHNTKEEEKESTKRTSSRLKNLHWKGSKGTSVIERRLCSSTAARSVFFRTFSCFSTSPNGLFLTTAYPTAINDKGTMWHRFRLEDTYEMRCLSLFLRPASQVLAVGSPCAPAGVESIFGTVPSPFMQNQRV